MRTRVRVLHVVDHLGYGGGEIIVRNIAEKLASQTVDAWICALRTNPTSVPVSTKLISLTYASYNPCTFLAVARLAREHNIDIIHAHLEKSIISSLLASFLCDSKIIIHEHGGIFRGGLGRVYRLLLRLLRSRISVAIANSNATQSALSDAMRIPREAVRVVSNFIDMGRFDRARYGRENARQSLGIPEGGIVVGFVGRLERCKGPDLFLEAAAMLLEDSDRYHFVLVGYGKQRENLQRTVTDLGLDDRVVFTGLQENPAEVMVAFDVGVIPSRREGFGIGAVELMRMRVPVIAAPVGGLVELVRHEETGILLEQLTAESIARAVDRLAKDTSLRERLTENAEVFSRKFDGKEQLRRIEEIYRRLCS